MIDRLLKSNVIIISLHRTPDVDFKSSTRTTNKSTACIDNNISSRLKTENR